MQIALTIELPVWQAPRYVREEQAAAILERSRRTVRYYVQQGLLGRSANKLVLLDDVYRLKAKLANYYKKPFRPGSRSRKGKGK